jgi:hypothetical protein
MKNIIILSVFIFSFLTSIKAEKPETFAHEYNKVSFFSDKEGEFGPFVSWKTTFVYNYKGTSDILIKMPDYDPIILTPILDKVTEHETDKGIKFQYMKYIDDSGNIVELYFYDSIKRTMLVMSDAVFLFAKSSSYPEI